MFRSCNTFLAILFATVVVIVYSATIGDRNHAAVTSAAACHLQHQFRHKTIDLIASQQVGAKVRYLKSVEVDGGTKECAQICCAVAECNFILYDRIQYDTANETTPAGGPAEKQAFNCFLISCGPNADKCALAESRYMTVGRLSRGDVTTTDVPASAAAVTGTAPTDGAGQRQQRVTGSGPVTTATDGLVGGSAERGTRPTDRAVTATVPPKNENVTVLQDNTPTKPAAVEGTDRFSPSAVSIITENKPEGTPATLSSLTSVEAAAVRNKMINDNSPSAAEQKPIQQQHIQPTLSQVPFTGDATEQTAVTSKEPPFKVFYVYDHGNPTTLPPTAAPKSEITDGGTPPNAARTDPSQPLAATSADLGPVEDRKEPLQSTASPPTTQNTRTQLQSLRETATTQHQLEQDGNAAAAVAQNHITENVGIAGGGAKNVSVIQTDLSDKSPAMKGSLIAALVFGVVFSVVVMVFVGKKCYDGYRRRYYTKVDFLMNGKDN